jgi:predicted metalloprotease with PDZ domain
VTLKDPVQHRVHVEIRGLAQTGQVVQLPVWNALYQVRDFSQFVEWVRASDVRGGPSPVRKRDKTTWWVPGADAVEYDIVLDTPGPYSAQFNRDHAFLNLAQVLMYVPGQRELPVVVSFEGIPDGWQIATVLNRSSEASNRFSAANYDALVDAPFEIGRVRDITFNEGGGKYRVVIHGSENDYDANKLRESVRKIARAEVEWMDDRPCDEYLFIYHFPRGVGGGGMEHACSTAIDVTAERMHEGMNAFESVTAHEFFHLWNVKRIRPESLEPVDYTREQYTRALWFSEGVTSTVENYALLRAGLMDEGEYLRNLASEIAMLQGRPAHLTQSAEESSLDTWYDKYAFYRRPERSISYYNKGEVLGGMLDLAIRESTGGTKSLREVFRWMNENYAKRGLVFNDSDGVRDAVEKVTGKKFEWFFRAYVAGAEEVPYDKFLNTAGLKLQITKRTAADAGFSASRNFDALQVVAEVTPGGGAEQAGLRAGDAIIAMNGKRNANVADVLRSMSEGDRLRLIVRTQGGSERELKFEVGSREVPEYSIVEVAQPTAEQKARRAQWLVGPQALHRTAEGANP